MRKKHLLVAKKVLNLFLSAAIILNSFSPLLTVSPAYAQEVEPTPIVETIPEPTPTLEATVIEPTAEPSPTVIPTEVEESLLEPTPTVEVTPVVIETTPELNTTQTITEPLITETINLDSPESQASAQLNPTLTTDKADYAPTDTAIITGSDYQPNTAYTVVVSSQDEPAVRHQTQVITDGSGNLYYSYQLDGIYRPDYLVEIFLGSTLITSTTFTDSHILSHLCVNDAQGANDEPGQKDLTLMCSDQSNQPTSIEAEWNWDDISWSGNNSGDGCSLFDTDNDNMANFSVCVTVKGNPAIQDVNSPRIYLCNDSRSDRCSGSSLVPGPYTSTCSVTQEATQPFNQGANSLNDTNAQCTIQLSEVGGGTVAKLIDVCSYPSQQPNSDPSDCILAPTNNDTGTIEVIKDLQPSNDSGRFNLQIDGENMAINVGDGGTTGQLEFSVGSHTIGEIAYTGTSLLDYNSSINCSNNNGSISGTGPLQVELSKNENIVCTITNTRTNGSIAVHKDVQGPGGEAITDTSAQFTVQLDGGNSQSITDNGTVTFSNVSVGSHTVTESVIPAGYTLHSISPDADVNTSGAQVTVTPGQTTDVYVVNRQASATVIVHKDVLNPDGGPVTDDHGFTVNINDSPKTIKESATASYTLAPGTYTVTENSDPNYDFVSISPDDDLVTAGYQITLSPGENLNVYVVNKQKKTTIEVIKDVLNPDGGAVEDNHSFTAQLNGGNSQSFSETSITTYSANPGSYDITELADNDYTYISCTPDSNQTVSDGAQITVTSNQTLRVTCTNKQKPVTITVNKDVRKFDGTDTNDNTTFTVNQGQDNRPFSELSPAVYSLFPGTYTFTESPLTNYTLYSVSPDNDVDINNGTTITLGSNGSQSILFTNRQNAGQILGSKLVDLDGSLNTSGDQSKLTTESWLISLYTCTDGTFVNCSLTSSTSTSNGDYGFTNLSSGYYELIEETKVGWTNLLPTLSFFLNPAESKADQNFINFQNVSIKACKVEDLDGNLTTTNDQSAKSGWSVSLIKNTQTIDTQLTGNDGCYTWTNQEPGIYGVSEATDINWTALTPTTHNFGQVLSDNDYVYTFANFHNVNLSGQKFHDFDRDGTKDATDSGLANWTIRLLNSSDVELDTELTDVNGNYSFNNLGPGTYRVREVQRGGWTQTTANPADITFTSGSNVSGIDFGNFQINANISIEKLLASTTDLEILVGETASFTISITNNGNVTLINPVIYDTFDASYLEYLSSSPIDPATGPTTPVADGVNDYDNDGNTTELVSDLTWNLPNLAPGETYTITVNFKALQISPDSPIQTFTGNVAYATACYESCSYNEQLKTQEDNALVDVDTLGQVGGYKFNDVNGNGQKEDDETFLGGVTIQLKNAQDQVIIMTVTDGQGLYSFTSLTTGDYKVCELAPAGYIQTFPSNNGCHQFSITDDGENIIDKNFGNQGRAKITVEKQIEPENDDIFEFNLDGSLIENENFLLEDGNTKEFEVPSGIYTIEEETNPDYTTTYQCTDDEGQTEGNQLRTVLEAGDDVTCVFTNSIKRGSITIIKETLDETEESFTFNFSDAESTFTLGGGDSKLFENLLPGNYSVSETVPAGWELDNVSCTTNLERTAPNYQNIDLDPGEDVVCTFTNAGLPSLGITKDNDRKGEALGVNEIVTYTITVRNDGQAPLFDVYVEDAQPIIEYFEYLINSGVVTAPDNTTANVVATGSNPFTWYIADVINPGETYTLNYQIKILNTNIVGNHYNLAFAHGMTRGEDVIYSDIIEDPFAIGSANNPSTSIKLAEGEVLGAATGTPSFFASFGLFLLGLGLLLKLPKKYLKVLPIIALAMTTFTGAAHAIEPTPTPAPVRVQMVDLPGYKNTDNFEISYTAHSINGIKNVRLEYKRDGIDWTTLTILNSAAGKFQVNSGQINQDGNYSFRATATDNSNFVAIDETSTNVDRHHPPTPESFSKEGKDSNTYLLRWYNPDSDQEYRVIIYRSDKPDFTADNNTQIAVINVTRITTSEWFNDTPGDKTYYYAIRTIDAAGNVSGLATDQDIQSSTSTSTSPQGTPVTGNEIFEGKKLVSGTGTGGQVLGENEEQNEENNEGTPSSEEIQRLLEESENDDEEDKSSFPWSLVLVGAALAATIYFTFFKKK